MEGSTSQPDPFSLLGVEPTARASDVRLAFRKAALKYHPDLFEGDSSEAQAAFCRLVDAYRRAMRAIANRGPGAGRAVSPQELAAMDALPCQWDFVSLGAASELLQRGGVPSGTKVRSMATLDEPWVFNLTWIVALLAAVGAMALLAERRGGAPADAGGVLGIILLPFGLYAAFLAAGLGILLLTRRAVYLVMRLRNQRFLPKPNTLPRRSLLKRLLGK